MRLRDLWRDRAVWLFLLLTAVLFYQPLTTETFYFRDLHLLFYPKKVLLADAIRAGTFPLWDPFTNGGQPYLAAPQSAALHPSNLLYLFLPTLVAFNVVPVLHIFFCAVAAYWLARVVGLSAVSAFVAGAVYAFAGVTLSGINLGLWPLALPWIPLTIGLTHRAIRDGRSIAPAAIAASMPLFAGSAELTAFLFVLVFVWVAAVRAKRLAMAALVLVAAFGLSLVATLPATSVVAQSSRGAMLRTYEGFTAWSVSPARLPELMVPRFFGSTNTFDKDAYWGKKWETLGFPYMLSIYFGAAVLILAVVGARGRLEGVDAPRIALAVLAICALLLCLGHYLPGFRLIFDHVPLVTLFRYPVKALALMLLPLALLAGCGVERIARMTTSARTYVLVAAAIGSALAIMAVLMVNDAQRPTLSASLAHAAIATLAFAAAMISKKRAIAVAIVVTADLFIAGWFVNDYAPREIFNEPRVAALVREVVGPMRFHAPRSPVRVPGTSKAMHALTRAELVALNDYSATTFGIPVVFHTDYDQLAPRPIAQLKQLLPKLTPEQKRALFDRAGVRAFLSRDEVRLPGITEAALVDLPSGRMHLYANASAVPARFVGRTERATDPPDALRRILISPELSRVVLSDAHSPAGGCAPAPVRLLRRELNAARYEVDAPCDGYVVFAENHNDGWRATIDGRGATHVRADFAFTAVRVAKGRHVIERGYVPPRLLAGAVGTLLTAIVLAFVARQRSRKMG